MAVQSREGKIRAACDLCSWRSRHWHPFGTISPGGREQTDKREAAMAEARKHRETAHPASNDDQRGPDR